MEGEAGSAPDHAEADQDEHEWDFADTEEADDRMQYAGRVDVTVHVGDVNAVCSAADMGDVADIGVDVQAVVADGETDGHQEDEDDRQGEWENKDEIVDAQKFHRAFSW